MSNSAVWEFKDIFENNETGTCSNDLTGTCFIVFSKRILRGQVSESAAWRFVEPAESAAWRFASLRRTADLEIDRHLSGFFFVEFCDFGVHDAVNALAEIQYARAVGGDDDGLVWALPDDAAEDSALCGNV